MGVYARKDSPFWWLWLESTGRRLSSGIPIGAKHQRKDSRRQAEDIYLALMGDIARKRFNLPIDRPARTFREHATWYWETTGKHQKGQRRVQSMIRALIAYFGDVQLTEIDEAAIKEWQSSRLADVAKATANRELDVLKPLLRSAVEKYLAASPADAVKRFQVRRFTPVTILTADDEDKLLAVADPEERAYVLLGLDTLLRQGDVRRFRVEHNHGTHIEIVDPKTGEPYKVPASLRLQAALKALTPHDGWYFARLRRRGPKKGTWQPISENTAFEMFRDLCDRAGVTCGRADKGMTFHGLRHTGATRAMKATKATAVMRLGGWASLRQLVRYDHPDDPDMIRGVEAIGSRATHAPSETKKKPPKKRRF